MNEGKIAGMNRLHGGLVRVVHNVNPGASVSIVLYDECQAKMGVSNSNCTRKLANELIIKGFAVIGMYSGLKVGHIRISRPPYRTELLAGTDDGDCRPLIFCGPGKSVVISMAETAVENIKARGEEVYGVLDTVSPDNGRTWGFVGPFHSKNNEDKTFLRVALGVSSFKISFNFNVL